jgi:hypothetical protein
LTEIYGTKEKFECGSAAPGPDAGHICLAHIGARLWIQGCGTERNGIDRQWSVYHTRSIVCPRHILLHVHIRILRHEVFREERAHFICTFFFWPFSSGGFFKACFPISSKRWWFMTYYMIIFLLSPILNSGCESLSKNGFLLIISLLVLYQTISFIRIEPSGGCNFLGLLTIFLMGMADRAAVSLDTLFQEVGVHLSDNRRPLHSVLRMGGFCL